MSNLVYRVGSYEFSFEQYFDFKACCAKKEVAEWVAGCAHVAQQYHNYKIRERRKATAPAACSGCAGCKKGGEGI